MAIPENYWANTSGDIPDRTLNWEKVTVIFWGCKKKIMSGEETYYEKKTEF